VAVVLLNERITSVLKAKKYKTYSCFFLCFLHKNKETKKIPNSFEFGI
jgi:hypothetical protein